MFTNRLGKSAFRLIIFCIVTCFFIITPALIAADKDEISIEFVRFSPMAIFSDGKDSTTVTVRVIGPVKKVFLDASQLWRYDFKPAEFLVKNKVTNEFELFDNGKNGDKTANDHIFSRSDIRGKNKTMGHVYPYVRVVDNDDVIHEFNTYELGEGMTTKFYFIPYKYRVPVTKVDSQWQMSKQVANLKTTSLIKLTDSTSTSTPPSINAVRTAYLSRFPDNRDFILIYLAQPTNANYYFYTSYMNNIQGLGISPQTTAGSKNLRGIILLQNTPAAFLHELTHCWGVFLKNPEFQANRPHWGVMNIPGLLYGMDFEPAGSGTFRVTSEFSSGVYDNRPVRYAPMELYLMGLLPADQVPNVTVLEGIDNPNSLRDGDIMKPTGVKTVTIENIIAANGKRLPNAASSQKVFGVSAVLITYGTFASDAEMAAFSLFQKNHARTKTFKDDNLGRSFYVATGKRAKLNINLPQPLKTKRLVPAAAHSQGRTISCPECEQK